MFEKIKAYHFNLLPQLTNQEWQAYEDCLTVKKYAKGELIVKEGEICNYVYFVNSGLTRFYLDADGREVSLEFIGDNEYVSAYESFLTRMPACENLEALKETELMQLSFDDLQMLYHLYPAFQIIGRIVAEQLFICISRHSNALMLLTPEQRYQQLIANGSPLLQQVPQYMLASYIGVTPEHLSRIRKKIMKPVLVAVY